jgi:hypothetical protein
MTNPPMPLTGRVGMGGRTTSYHSPAALIKLMQEGALYASCTLPVAKAGPLMNYIQEHGMRVDAHCLGCKQGTTYVLSPRESRTIYAEQPTLMQPHINDLSAMLGSITFHCSRVPHAPSHNAHFCFKVADEWVKDQKPEDRTVTIIKIGQWPSLADMASAKFAEYEKLISPDDLAELRRAVGLAAHGIGIGAFVYLRRIFERLVQRAEASAGMEPAGLRMDERIAALDGTLPEFVVKNRKFYGIVSKGIHELSEQDCIEAFPIVEAAVLLMLDEVSAAAKRKARLQQAEVKLGKLQEKLSKNDG